MALLELLLFRLTLWVFLPCVLLVFAIGPARVANAWRRFKKLLFDGTHEPAEVLDRVVKQHRQHITALKNVIDQAEVAKIEVEKNRVTSAAALNKFEREAQDAVARGDDLGAKGALYRANLEKVAVQAFEEQQKKVEERIDQSRERLYKLELQLRQYEVGKTLLLSQLAEAKTVEQQYALVNQFDPFSAVAAWQETEGVVKAATSSARATDRVLKDTAEMPLVGQPMPIDPATLDAQLAELKAKKPTLNGYHT